MANDRNGLLTWIGWVGAMCAVAGLVAVGVQQHTLRVAEIAHIKRAVTKIETNIERIGDKVDKLSESVAVLTAQGKGG